MRWFWQKSNSRNGQKTREEHCLDGRTLTIYNDVDDAFPAYFTTESDRRTKLGIAGIQALGLEGANASYNQTQKASELRSSLDEINASNWDNFRGLYVQLQINACGFIDEFDSEMKSIRASDKKLRAAKMALAPLAIILSQPNVKEELIEALLTKVYRILFLDSGGNDIWRAQEANGSIAESRSPELGGK